MNLPAGPFSFTVNDTETPAAGLVVTGRSSNAKLVSDGGLVVEGSGTSRSIFIFPAANEHGSVTITVTVKDADGATATSSFTLTVLPPPGQPPPSGQPPGTVPPGEKPPGEQPPTGQPPGQQPPGETPPGQQPPGTQPPGQVPPGTTPPGTQPPATTPPGTTPPPGEVPSTIPTFDQWVKSPEAKDLNADGKIDEQDYQLFLRQSQPPDGGEQPPTGQPPTTGQPPGQQPPGETPPGQQPPGTQPPGQVPPGTTPPGGTQPPTTTPPGTTPPGTQPPATTPPGTTPPSGEVPPTVPTFDQWVKSSEAKDLNADGKIDEKDFQLLFGQLLPPPTSTQPPPTGTQPPGTTPPGTTPPGTTPPATQPPGTIPTDVQPPSGQVTPTIPSFDQWLRSNQVKDFNGDGKIDDSDFQLFLSQFLPPTTGTQPPGTGTQPPTPAPPGTVPPGGEQPPAGQPPTGQPPGQQPPGQQPPATPNQPPKVSFIGPQVIEAGKASPAISFTIEDSDTPGASLTVSATSSNNRLVPNSGISISGSGSRRSIVVTPASGESGTTDIKITVSDGGRETATTTFTLSVVPPLASVQPPAGGSPPTQPPTGEIPPGQLPPGTTPPTQPPTGTTPPGTIPPGQEPPGTQPPAGTPSGTTPPTQPPTGTVPPGQTPPTGTPSGQLPPAAAANTPPTISPIASQSLAQGRSSVSISFTVADLETAAAELKVNGESSNPSLVPNSNISLSGAGFNRIATITVVPGQSGATFITITVTDSNGGKASTGFTLAAGVSLGTTTPGQPPTTGQPTGTVPPGQQPPTGVPSGQQPPGESPTGTQPPVTAPPGQQPPAGVPTGQPPVGGTPTGQQPPVESPPPIVPQVGPTGATPAAALPTATLPPDQIPNAPTILADPQNVETIAGASASFSVTVVGKLPLSYQWRFNGNAIPGATSSVLAISNVQESNVGSYSVEITNTDGKATSKEATLKLVTLLRIVVQPVSQVVLPGDNVSFSVEATGAATIRYQWQFNSADIPGATSAKLDLRNVSAKDSGVYSVIVRSDTASAASLGAFLGINELVQIVRQPQSQPLAEGGRATFSVEAIGTPPLRYQWQFNGVDIPGQTSSVLELANVTAANAGQYSVVVGNRTGSAQSEKASLIVSALPTILRQPQGRAALAGEPTSFSVTASGTPPLGYQWRLNGADIPGATDSTYIVPAVTAASEGDYTVLVRNIAGSVTSEAAKLTVSARPRITQQPQRQTASGGGTASFGVVAEGTPPITYQWQFNGANIAGANSATLTLQNIRATDAGAYQVVVSNPSGHVLSDAASLLVNVPITIVAGPQSQTAAAGGTLVFTVSAVGTPPLSYQWRFNGSNLPGATGPSFSVGSVQPSNAGQYSVVVQNVAGSATSGDATLTVNVPPSIQTHPASRNATPGDNVTFSVTATGGAPLSYQWQKNGQTIGGATNPTLTLSNVQAADAGSYDVVVTNPGGAITSQSASLTLVLPQVQGGKTAEQAPPPVETREGTFDGGSNAAVGGAVARKNAPPSSSEERWFSWKAPATGIVSFNTAGSTFDTVLAIYTGTPPNNLSLVGIDDDRGGFFNSEVKFNAVQGTTYLVKVVGYGGAAGRIVVNFKLQETTQRLPVLIVEPQSQTVALGAAVTLAVVAQGTDLSYQWLANGVALPGATDTSYRITNVQEKDALRYTVRVRSGTGAQAVEIESLPATIQIGAQETSARDKFKNLPILGGSTTPVATQSPWLNKQAGGSVARGYSGSQVFNTFGATKEQGEPNHADEIGGASQWFSYTSPDTGTLRVSTEGSDFDTVLAIYTGPGTDFASLKAEAFDNNGGADGKTSVVTVKAAKNTNYYVAVDGVKGATGSVKIGYALGAAPVISKQPSSQSVKIGDGVGLFVEVTDPLSAVTASTTPATYQWFKDGVAIAGETSRSLALPNVQIASGGEYTVVVSNFAGTVASQAAKLTVNVALTVSTPPLSQTAKVGDSVEFRAVVSGTEPIKYQWRINGTDIAGATGSTYRIPSAQGANAGRYTIFAQNDISSIESAAAILTITQAPVISGQPADQSVLLGAKAAFAVTATGTAPLSYQWRQNGVNIAGAASASFEIASVAPASAGEYTVVVSNPVDSTVSSPARLALLVPLGVVEQPQSQTVTVGSSAVFTVRAAGSGPFAYQWRKGTTPIPNATNPHLTLSNVQASDAGSYSVVVTSGAESVSSAAATLTVSAAPLITEQPKSQVGFVGSSVAFSVTATGSEPLSYQWFRNGEPIAGATDRTLTIAEVKVDLAGSYAVLVSNSAGSTVSDIALLTTRQVVSDPLKGLNGFQFRVSVPEGKRARLQVSSDLATWVDLTSTPITGTVDIQDTQIPGSGLKFYRVLVE
ncbi:MAG: immunoglobulin domain-containing protein [Verrucomicrobia bacterium]|nr:immunoglobulin domain-containing protein [Verrucomicrobiota bacterium]